MENNWKTILTIKILRRYIIRRHREEKGTKQGDIW